MSEISEKVAKLDAVRRELLGVSGAAAGDEYRLFPPPAPGEVRAYERRRGRSLPSSFRSFLELANGWRGFMRGWTLLGLRRRETELFFREGLDEKIVGALPDLVPDAELRTLSTREKTDPKVLSPRDHQVIGVDGRGSALVLDDLRSNGGEPEVALVKYIWVQRRWPNLGAMLDEALRDATQELEKVRAKQPPPSKAKVLSKTAKKAAIAKLRKVKARPTAGAASGTSSKLRVVEIQPSPKSKTKTKKAEKKAPKIAAKPAKTAAKKVTKKKR